MAKRILLALVIVALIAGIMNIPYVKDKVSSSSLVRSVFTIGFAGTAYAMTPDVTVGHGNDSEVVQAVLDALPAWGGKIELWAGTSSDHYQFAATVERAIPNVCFEGDGYATYIEGNGTMPLFNDGGQANWTFRSLRTDAGGITRTGAGSMVLGCWIDTTYTDDTYLMKSTTFSGDVSGTYSSIAVTNDSHSHTGTTLSSIDISADTNLAASSPVTLTDDTVGVDTSTFVMQSDVLAGDVTGNITNTVVGDDSHAHTSSTISGLDVSSDTNLAASAPITLTDDTVGIDTSTFVMQSDLLAGDVTGNTSATIVGDDSHNHTGATLSGIDISDDTNLAVSAPITLTDDTVGVSDATTTSKGVALYNAVFFGLAAGNVSLLGNIPNLVHSDSGDATPSSNAFTIAGGEGIDTSGAGSTVTIAGEDASDTNKGVASFASTDFAVSSGAVSMSRQRNIILTAAGGTPSTTSGCAYPAQVELTSGIDVWCADFDATGNESIQWAIIWPDEYGADGTYTMTAVFEWTIASGSGDVVWGIQGGSWADNEAPTLGTSVWVTDTAGTATRPFFTSATAAVTLSGTPAAGEHAQFKVWRGADSGSDTLATDARLISVKVVFHAK